jgi:drug/metabolite transporter (DMT)-like permease
VTDCAGRAGPATRWPTRKLAATAVIVAGGVVSVGFSVMPWYSLSYHTVKANFDENFTAWHTYSTAAVVLMILAAAVSARGLALARGTDPRAFPMVADAVVFTVVALALEAAKLASLDTGTVAGVHRDIRWGAWGLVVTMGVCVIAAAVAAGTQPRRATA